MKNFKGHTITIRPDQSKSYLTINNAVLDCGYELDCVFENHNPVSGYLRKDVYERLSDGRLFVIAKSESYCTTVYSVKLRELTEEGKKLTYADGKFYSRKYEKN